ncbi:MAG: elongation factor P hydroxylase [Legionellales bacterium]
MHQCQDLITIFNQCFSSDYNTQLVKGEDEPIYLPADIKRTYNALIFAHGFFSSALHECSHWLIAGEQRRTLIDFGYWYAPDGRTEEQQEQFQKMEVKPQALEWILSKASGHRFRLSIDNLNGAESDTEAFKHSVHRQVLQYCSEGLSKRAQRFRLALCSFYGSALELQIQDFTLEEL